MKCAFTPKLVLLVVCSPFLCFPLWKHLTMVSKPTLPRACVDLRLMAKMFGFLEFRFLTSHWLLAIHNESFSPKRWFFTNTWPWPFEFHWRSINSTPNMKQGWEGKMKNKKKQKELSIKEIKGENFKNIIHKTTHGFMK